MSDPYGILGVSSNASDEDVKKAYRELARKYHPDNYQDNPLADLAEAKMKEINEAYDQITRSRENKSQNPGTGYGYGSTSTQYTGTTQTNMQSARVRAAINAGDIDLAEQMLRSFTVRNAEWNFLMGCVYYRKGWLDDALTYFENAVGMDPNNFEYRQAINMMYQRSSPTYTRYGQQTAVQNCDSCDICTALMCLNLCCRCR